MLSTLHILLIEPSFLIREGLKTLLSQQGVSFRMEESETMPENLPKMIRKSKSRLVFLNPALLPENTFVNRVKQQFDDVIFVGLISNDLPEHIKSPFDALMNVLSSKTELDKNFEHILKETGCNTIDSETKTLSNREIEILRAVALGLTNAEIGERLFISVHTAMTHRKNIGRKLGIKTIAGLTVYALLNKIISAQELDRKNSL